MIDSSPLTWGEGGESSEPGEGFLPSEPRNFGIQAKDVVHFRSRTKGIPACAGTTRFSREPRAPRNLAVLLDFRLRPTLAFTL